MTVTFSIFMVSTSLCSGHQAAGGELCRKEHMDWPLLLCGKGTALLVTIPHANLYGLNDSMPLGLFRDEKANFSTQTNWEYYLDLCCLVYIVIVILLLMKWYTCGELKLNSICYTMEHLIYFQFILCIIYNSVISSELFHWHCVCYNIAQIMF